MPIYAKGAVVFDLEFTAWDGSMANRWLRPGEFKEVIQIGAVKVDAGFAPVASFDALVRPRINPVPSPYLERLTGITNADIAARGADFAEAYAAFRVFCGALPLFAYGRDDLVIADNLRLYGIDAPLPTRYGNVIEWMAERGIDLRGLHACDVGPALGVPFAGQKHNGLNDAISVAAGMRAALGRKAAQ
jgi:inhibitor of KinA sporulation pathway (predicted exonuclease)